MREFIKRYNALALKDGRLREVSLPVACEESVELFINNQRVATILTTPNMLEELALGFLVCEGAVHTPEDIEHLSVEDSKIFVTTKEREHFDLWCEMRSSGCVGVKWSEYGDIQPVPDTRFKRSVILDSLRYLESQAYHTTRGVHSACIVNQQGECREKVIDIGRHNAIDKVIGCALKDKLDLSKHFLLSTGRQSAGMVLKAARAGIPLIVTKTAPFNSGIDAAHRYNLTLVCFAKSDYLLITTHPEKIRIQE
jgi:FdhD protein